MWHWVLTVTGINAPGSTWYNLWSGFGSDIGLFGAIGVFYWKHTCHQSHCFRIGKHSPNGTPYCTKHHPRLK